MGRGTEFPIPFSIPMAFGSSTFQNADTSMDVRIAAVGAVGINRAAIRLRMSLAQTIK